VASNNADVLSGRNPEGQSHLGRIASLLATCLE